MGKLSIATLALAVKQIGVAEVPRGSNSGPEVNIYLKSVGLSPGYAWCMAFVYYCVDTAAKSLSIANPLVKTGGVLRQWNENRKLKTLPATIAGLQQVQAGDIFIMDFGGGNGHTGFVESVDVASRCINTIEGNSNAAGSREGYKVIRRSRQLTSIKGFLQLTTI
ncbi:CHAP domain-containing protein [Chitinophaga pendula]|uniref:CHAP domain-containing protein n=1 Tax=Chitinophaga TaxID=79328 RepID=UPI000BAF9875|nr:MULTISPECIES: CHAP domain-containing protein [Chitinophaga]ASZ11091.1 amidase [Chitinophaga sp. MD30]UCJ05912.1 CHAP domain-containing protein [Chitinophaga pendula]